MSLTLINERERTTDDGTRVVVGGGGGTRVRVKCVFRAVLPAVKTIFVNDGDDCYCARYTNANTYTILLILNNVQYIIVIHAAIGFPCRRTNIP